MCKGLDHDLQAHLARSPVIAQENGLHQTTLFVSQFHRYNHQVPKGFDRRHQERSNPVSRGLILRRHQSNSTTWQQLSALTAARILEESRVLLAANLRVSPTVQRPASKTQMKTKLQLLANFSRPLLSLQLLDPLHAVELPIPQFQYQLLRALIGIHQEKLQLDLSCLLAPIPY